MNNEQFLKDIEFLDPESQRLLRSLQHSVIPIQKLQGQGYVNFQDVMVDKIELGENIRGMNNVSPLATFKFFNQTSDEINSKYFIDASPPLEGTFSYVSDVGSNLDNEIKTMVKDFYYYNVKDVRNFAFKVVIFSSTEATKLKECFDVAQPLGREILIFIEDNSTDSVSGTYGAIRISQEVLDFLKPGNRLAYDVKDNQNIYTELKAAVPGLTDDQIKSLLHNGYIEDNRIEAVTTWLKIASFFSSTVSMMYPSLGILTNDLVRKSTSDLLGKIIKKIEEAKFKENQWQPKAPKNEKGETDKNYQYQPLISVDEKDNANINIAQFTKVLQKMLEEQKDYVKTELKISKNFSGNSEPNSILEFLYQKYYKAYTIAKSVISQIQSLSDLEILKYGAKTYNALLCGVWNGLVDAVAGLFAMVKLLYDGITLGKDFVKNIDKYLPTLLEQFDEAIQAIEKLNFTEIAKYVYNKLKGNGLTFDPIACAYFVGYAFGFIISLIIEIVITVFLTGASLTIPVILEKLSEALFGIFRLAWAGTIKIARTFGNFVVKSIDDVLKGFQELLKFLKKGWDEFRKFIDDVFNNFKKTVLKQFKDIEFINGYDIDKILKFEKANRLDPSEYLSARYIKAHLKKFDDGAVRFTSKTAFQKYGTLGPDGAFVMPKKNFDEIIKGSKGDLEFIEKALGFEPGYLKGDDIMIAFIKKEDFYELKIPSGNENGANPFWLPGGYTSGKTPEAVMNLTKKVKFNEIKLY